jgi:4-amino-4-deoxy-L-arabinose transferase-like glycosyltransferase
MLERSRNPMATHISRGSGLKEWLAAHPVAVIGALLAMALGPFLNQAVQTDDALFVWTAQQIHHHPLDFFGFNVNWWGSAIPMWKANCNPPLWPYLLAVVGGVAGWSEIALHLAGFGVALAAAAGTYCLARRWCSHPMLATVMAMIMPAFLVSSTTLMCDVTMLACWVWAVFFWERAGGGESRWNYLGAGALAALAVLAKYSGVNVVLLLAVLSIPRDGQWRRDCGWKLAGLGMAPAALAGYEWLTQGMYGHGLLSLAGHYARTTHFDFPGGEPAKLAVGLAFAGGSWLATLFMGPWLWRRRLAAAAVLAGCGVLLWLWLGGNPGIMHPWVAGDNSLIHAWDFRLQVVLMMVAGIHVLLLTGAEVARRRDRITVALVWWILSVAFFTIVLNWTINVRSFLPAVPAVAILAARRWSALQTGGIRWLALPLAAAGVVTFSVIVANWQFANTVRDAARKLAALDKPGEHFLWFNGHGGFQYYMEKFGGHPLNMENADLSAGDLLVTPMQGDLIMLPVGCSSPVKALMMRPPAWMNIHGRSVGTAAGFYTADDGPIPYAVGRPGLAEYFVAKMATRVRFHSQVSNPQEVAAGSVPSFPNLDYTADDAPTVAELPAAQEQVAAAAQMMDQGRDAEAVRLCENALVIQSNNPSAMSRLAWLLATSRQADLRDSRRAVALANQVVIMTESRQAMDILVQGAAFASDGQWDNARSTLELARNFAVLTGQPGVRDACVQIEGRMPHR